MVSRQLISGIPATAKRYHTENNNLYQINLLRRAKELGDYLIVGVTNDNFDRERGKLNVRNNVL